jgi:hypothetical protein
MDYDKIMGNLISSNKFNELSEEDQQRAFEQVKDEFIQKNPDYDPDLINRVTEQYNKIHLRRSGQGRAMPDLSRVELPTQNPDEWNNLSQTQKREKIEEFEAKIPEIANKYPTMKEDAEFFFKKYSQGLTRENETQDQGRVADHFNRAVFHGFAGGLLNYVGLPDASDAVKNTFHTRPDLDESWSGAFAQGAGDLAASMTVFIGAMAATRGMGGSTALAANVATGASLGTNSIMRYNEAYRNALDSGLDENAAAESGFAAVPAAAIDVMGDRILALKLLPNNATKIFSTGTSAQKRAALSSMFKDNMTRPKLMEVARAAFSEGITEVAGDYYASTAPYLLHEENKDYLPSDKDLFKSFVIGSVLGGTMAGGAMGARYLGDKKGIDGKEYSNKDMRDIGEVDRNFDSIQDNQEVWKAMSEGRWSEAYNITRTVVEDNIKREQEEATRLQQEREAKIAEFGTTLDPEININFPNESTNNSDTLQQQGSFVGTFEFTPPDNDPVKNQIYSDLFESNMDATGQLTFDKKARTERTQRLNQAAPQRVRFLQELESTTKDSGIQKNQTPSILAYTDTLAAKWLSKNPERSIDDFYAKINIKSVDSKKGFNSVIAAYKQQGKAVIGVTPKDNFANFMGEMLTSFRKADLLQDILLPSEIQQLKDSLGVSEFDNNSDKELSKQFINWLDNTYTGPEMTGVFSKIKEWVADIYKSVQMWLPRNIGMDSVFESLFQVTLTPNEFNNRIGQQFSATPAENVTSKATVDQLRNKQPNRLTQEQTNTQAGQSAAKTRSQRSRDRFNKAANITPVESEPVVEVGDVTPDAQQTPREFLKGRAWAMQVVADLENNAPNVRVQVLSGKNNFEGKYHNGVIYLDMDSIRDGSELERIFKHEAAHALTIGYLNSLTKNLQGEALVKRLKELQNDASLSNEAMALIKAYFYSAKKLNIKVGQRFNVNNSPKISGGQMTRRDYAFTTLDEFIAEALSNPDFQADLANIKYGNKSVFEHILDLINSLATWATGYTTQELFGKYDGQNVLAEVMLAAHQMFGEQAAPFNPPFSPKFSPRLDASNISTGRPVTAMVYRATSIAEGLRPKLAKEGELGSGIYLAGKQEDASIYLDFDAASGESATGRRLAKYNISLKNPLVVRAETTGNYPSVNTLVELGQDREKAMDRVEKSFEEKGSVGKWIQSAVEKAGHDGIIYIKPSGSIEVVAYKADNVVEVVDREPLFSPKDLLKATDEKNPASVMQKFVDIFQSKIKQSDRTLYDASRIADTFISNVFDNILSKTVGETSDKLLLDFRREAQLLLSKNDSYSMSVIEDSFTLTNNFQDFKNTIFTKLDINFIDNLTEYGLKEKYEKAKYDISLIGQTFIKVPSGNTLSLDAYLNVNYVDVNGNRIRELYNPENPIHALHASDLTKAIYRMDNEERADRLQDLAREVAKERYRTIESLVDYLYENQDYTSIEKAIILAAALKYSYTTNGNEVTVVEMTESNELLPAITGGDSASLSDAIKTESSLKKAFKKAVENNIKFQQEQNSSKNGWVRHEQSDKMEDAITLMNDCAGTPWCTGRSENTAHSQLRMGNFDTLFVDGKPQVAIRTYNGKIEEVRGTLSDQSLTPEQEQWAAERIQSSDYIGGEDFLSDVQLKKDLLDIIQNKDFEKLLILSIKDNTKLERFKPKKKFRGAIGHGSTGEFEKSIYDALDVVKKEMPDGVYETDLVYYISEVYDFSNQTILPKKINKKYIYIEGGTYYSGIELNGEDVSFSPSKKIKGENESLLNYIENKADVNIKAETLSIYGYNYNLNVEAKNITRFGVRDSTGTVNAELFDYKYGDIDLGEVKLKAKTIIVDSIIGGEIEVDDLTVKRGIDNSNISIKGDNRIIKFHTNGSIENSTIKAPDGFSINAWNFILKIINSKIDPVEKISASNLSLQSADLEGGILELERELFAWEDSSIKFKKISATHVEYNGDNLSILNTDYSNDVIFINSKIKFLDVNNAYRIHFRESKIDELRINNTDGDYNTTIYIENEAKFGKIIYSGHIDFKQEGQRISIEEAIAYGLVESVESNQIDDAPDANGGFLSPKIKTESAIRRERLAQIVETLPPTSILTELEPSTLLSLAGDSPTSKSVSREAKLNIKFTDVPTINLTGSEVTSSENAIIAQKMMEAGYEKVPVIISGDIVWRDQYNPSSENYVEEWPALITKKNGEQVASPFTREQFNYDVYYPQVSEQDIASYNKAYQEGDTESAKEILNRVAQQKGFDTTLYYRADVDPVTEVTRPLYLVPDESTARTMAEFYAKSRGGDLESFVYPYYIRKGLNFAKEGDKISGKILSTSSYMYGNNWSFSLYQNFTAANLRVEGFDGVMGIIDGTPHPEIVMLNPADAKSAAVFEHANGKLIQLNERFSDAADVRYSPRASFFKDNSKVLSKFKMIRQGRLSDQKDSQTTAIKRAMRKIKDSDLMKLTEEELNAFFNIVNNVYNSRMKGIKSPMNRAESDRIIEQLEAFNEMLNDMAIEEMINDFSGILDFSALDLDNITREELQKFINENQTEDQILAAVNKSDARKKAQQKIFDRYREKYNQAVEEIRTRYTGAQDYVTQMEQVHDTPIVEEKIRLAVMLHFDYLMSADVSTMNGNELYNHFFAVNNLLDGNITYVGETTVKNIAASNDTMENLSTYISTFRDPYWKRFGKFVEALDRINEKAELKQVRMDRITAVEKTREFLMNDLFGGLVQGIHSNASSRKKLKMDQYRNLILSLKERTGRYMNAEDRFLISAFARLIQHKYNESSDIALIRNINKEHESIQNIIDKQETESKHFEETFGPLFRKAVEGLEGEGSYDTLMKELSQRLSGTEGIKTGEARAEFIQGMIDIFYDFSLENKIISEGFHGIPFTSYANYSPNPVQITKFESRDSQAPLGDVLTDVLDNMEHHHNKEGIKTKSGHFFEREKALGKDKHYSYNPDFVVDRQLDNFTVDSATIFDRFLIAERLKKGSALSEVIGREEDGSYHADRINHLLNLAIEFVSHATSRSEPKNLLVNILRKFVNAYSRVTLSSVHHLISQPLAGMMDYAVRNGDIKGWFNAASYYALNRESVEQWLNDNASSFGQRGILESMGLDYKRLPQPELNIKSDAIIKKLETIYDGAGDVISTFIREGDKFGSRAVVLAHYLRMMQDKDPTIKSLNDIDWKNPNKRAFIAAMMKAEKNINASNKVNRGDFFTDRTPSFSVLRNVFMAFAAHPASLATQMNMAWRDLIDLKSQGAPKEDIAPKIRTIAAIATQTVSFAVSRFVIGSVVAKAMVAMLQDLFDDEEGKLSQLEEKLRLARLDGDHTLITAAEEELQLAKDARSVLLKMENQYKAKGLTQSIIRDVSGSLYFGFNSPTVLRLEPITTLYDKVGEKWHREAREERIKDYDAEIAKAREEENYHKVNSLKEQKFNFMQYQNIPLMYDVVGGLEIGGSYGGALNIAQKGTGDLMDAGLGIKEWNWNDWIIYAAVTGMGQSELRKILTNMDRIENSQFKTLQSYEERKDSSVLKQEEKENKEYEAFMRRVMR